MWIVINTYTDETEVIDGDGVEAVENYITEQAVEHEYEEYDIESYFDVYKVAKPVFGVKAEAQPPKITLMEV